MSASESDRGALDSAQRELVRDLVAAAMKVPVSERAAFVAERSGDDETVRAEALSLLEHAGVTDTLLASEAKLPASETIERARLTHARLSHCARIWTSFWARAIAGIRHGYANCGCRFGTASGAGGVRAITSACGSI